MPDDYRIVPAGDSALVVEFEATIDPVVNARALAVATSLRRAELPGVRDVVTAYRSVSVQFDPLRTDLERVAAGLRMFASEAAEHPAADGPVVAIPVCYGGAFGPDLGEVARLSGFDEAEVVRRHVATLYRVYMLGFVPGFAYLGVVDEAIAAPRRASPRLRVPSGSVGIAGRQTGVYPLETPGGWRLIGRTFVKPFDAARDDPFLVRTGDRVRFHPISPDEFRRGASLTEPGP
jgi:KipI family sensor histidine kinase inhibitor